jgi:TOBE domain
MAEPITIKNLGKTYPGGNQALRDVSLDVAPFTGLAGELRVRVRERGDNGTMLVEPDSGRPFRASAPAGAAPGEVALVMIRPTGVTLSTDESDGHHLTGRVTDVAFRGRGYDHAIDVNREHPAHWGLRPGEGGAGARP